MELEASAGSQAVVSVVKAPIRSRRVLGFDGPGAERCAGGAKACDSFLCQGVLSGPGCFTRLTAVRRMVFPHGRSFESSRDGLVGDGAKRGGMVARPEGKPHRGYDC